MRTLLLLLAAGTALAAPPTLLATMGSKASVSFGGKPVLMSVGETRDGAKLISIGDDQAVFEVNGKRSTVRLGQEFFAAGGTAEDGKGSASKAVLFNAGGGHFLAALSTANGGGVRGLIDTGASFLSLSAPQAAALGIKPDRARPVNLSTAQGTARAYRAQVSLLKVENIVLYNVDAVVHDGSFPQVPLIGMTVLNQLEMQREGEYLTLRKKY